MESFLANVDSAHLKARLNKIMADVNAVTSDAATATVSANSSEEAGQCVLEFVKFFVSVAEQHGTTPHAVLGQHVVSNVLIFVLERIVKPNLMTYCRVAERHAAIAVAASGDNTNAARCRAAKLGSGAASASTGRRDALEARRRRLRSDIIRPFIQLFQSLHTSLAEEGEPLMSWTTESGGRALSATRRAFALGAGGKHDELLASGSPGDAPPKSSSSFGGPQQGERGGRDDVWGTGDSAHEDGLLIDGASDAMSQAPLLWKNASPLNIVCNHILEVLESQWLVAVVGADYAALLIEVLRWSGYARLITPTYLVRLSESLVALIQRVSTPEEVDTNVLTVGPNLVAQAVADGRLWVAAPCADDACLYAQVLMRLCALPQITTAYPPSSSTATNDGMRGGGGAAAALAFVRRVMEVVKARHRTPTPDLRLEAYCIAALRQLCHRFRYDHPIAARAPVEVVRLLCDFFFLLHHTPRHDVWRLETMQFVTVVLSVALSDVVGEELWQDLHTHSRRAAADADAEAAKASPDAREMIGKAKSSEGVAVVDQRGTTGVAAVANLLLQPPTRHLVVLLHQSVFPTMQLIFTQHRHEYSFTSRRELFSFPCSPLQEVFDFGAVVLYVTSITHGAYCRWRAAQENRGGGGGTTRSGTVADQEKEWAEEDEDEGQMRRHGAGAEARRARTRLRDIEPGHGDAVDGVARDKAAEASDTARTPPPASPHPVEFFADALQEEFFMPAGPLESGATAGRTATTGNDDQRRPPLSAATLTRRRAGGAPLVLRIGTSSIRTSSAAVQDVVSDTALFLLHLFAQPCATLRVPETVADRLVEDVLLPLCGHFGLRLGQLLLAAVKAVIPRCSLVTQQYAFAVVAQRSLPTVPPVLARWAGSLDSVSSSRAPVARSDEDVLAPSEPVYHVLVVLLEQRLHRRHELGLSAATPDGAPRNGPSAGAAGSGQPDVSSGSLLSGLLLSWGDHYRTLIQRAVARLHAWEQDMRRVCEGAGATAMPTGVAAEAARLDPAWSAEKRSHAAGGAHDAPLPLLAASLALLLTRFATLVQCTRLWEMTLCPSTAVPVDPGTTEAAPRRRRVVGDDHSWGLSDGPAGDVGLSFLCHVAANATLFLGSVPVLTRASDGGSHTSDVTGGGVRVARQTGGVGADVLTVTSTSLRTRNALTGADTVALFSALQFTAWLDLAETYACVALRMCLARQQVAEQTEMSASLRLGQGSSLGGVPSLSTSSEAIALRLRGPLRREVSTYVEHVCTLLDAAVTSPSSQVPAVLRDAVDAHWMLRLPLGKGMGRADVQDGRVADEEVVAVGEDEKADTDAAAFGTGVSPLRLAASRRAAPRAFQVMLTLSAQASVAWLMRRAQLRHTLAALTPAAVSRQEGNRRGGGGGPPDTHTVVRPGLDASAMMLSLSMQCVQLLHLLLRWRRAALWSPPEESTYARDDLDAAGDRGAAAPAVAKDAPFSHAGADGTRASAAGECAESATEAGGGTAADFDSDEEASAAREDVRLLRASPDLYATPLSLLERFSAAGGGRLYYAVLWLCHHVAAELDHAHAVGAFFPLWTALHVLFRDVGTVLLDPAFACVDPRQTIARFTATLTARIFDDGVRGLSRWRPSNPTSREVTHMMAVSLHMSVDTLRTVLWAASRTRIDAYVVGPLADTTAIRRTIVAMLRDQHLLDAAGADSYPTADVARGSGEGGAAALDDILLPSHHRLLERLPFLPTILRALPTLLRLLALVGCLPPPPTDADTGTAEGFLCCRAVVQVLQVLFVRYRYQLGPGLCSGFLCGTVADIRWLLSRRHPATFRDAGKRGSQGCRDAAAFLYAHEGRLLELWTAQLTDHSRVDMPVCTPAWQCALLQAAFAVLPRCEPAVAEVLGRFSFEFLADKTPYEVRHHAALQVGTLFRTFSTRRTQVLHTLLTKAREAMLSSTETLCSTSLLALSEAVRAAPELLVDVLYTLLECWATRGFRHRRLVVACLERVSAWVLEGAGLAGAPAGGASLPRSLPYTHLCRMHVRPLLFKWLCEYRHPQAALPVECFGYTTQTTFVVQHLSVLLPLALLLLTETTEEQWSLFATRSGGDRCDAASAEGSLYERLVSAYTDTLVAKAAAENERAGEALGAARRRRRTEASGSDATAQQDEVTEPESQTDTIVVSDADVLHRLAPLCMLLAYFPGIVTQLLVFASHAPVPTFTGDAGGLADLGKARDSRELAGWPRRMGHADAAVEHRGSGGGHSSRASASDMTPTWASVAQRCLYWLEAQFNTADATMLAQSVGLVLAGRRHVSGDSAQPTFSAAAARAVLCNPTTASSAAEVLRYYLQHRSVWPHKRRAFDVVLAAQADAVMEALVVLHRTTAEVGTLVYGTPEQLQRALSWVAEKITCVPLPMPGPREPRTQQANSTEGCGATTAEEETTQGRIPCCTSSYPAHWEAYCLALLVPPAAAPNAEFHSPVTSEPSARRSADAAALTEDVMTRFLLQGNSTYLYALLHAAYRSSVALSSLELQLRALQQLSLLVHIATCWCSARVLAEPHALRLVLSHLLHWLRRSPAAAVRRLVCDALMHVWQVSRAGCGNVPRHQGTEPTLAAQRRHCRLMLARGLTPLTAVSPLIASTWAALCRSDPDLKRSDWQQRVLAYLAGTESRRATRVAAATAAEGKERVLAHRAIDVDEPTDDEVESREEGAARDGGPGASASAGAAESAADPSDCPLPLDGEQWTWAMYEAQRSACLAPLSNPRARGRLSGLQRLLRYVLGHDEEDSDEALEDVSGTVEGCGSNAGMDKLVSPESCAVSMQLIVEHTSAAPLPSAPLLQDITVAVDSTQALLVRCLHVASVCLRAGHVPPDTAGPTAHRRSRGRTGVSLRPAELSALDVRAVLLDTIQHLYRLCHCNVAALPAEYADAADPFRPLSPGYVADEDAHGVHAIHMQILSADAADDQLLAAFRLLRALALCIVLSGEAATLPPCAAAVSSAPPGMVSGSEWLRHEAQRSGSSASTLLAASESAMADDGLSSNQTAEDIVAGVLAQAYAHQLRTLEQLVWCVDADASELGMCALRTWVLCIASSLDKADEAEPTRPAEPLSSFDEAVVQLVVSAWMQQLTVPSSTAAAGEPVGASSGAPMPSPQARVRFCLQRRLGWVTRSGGCGSLACRRGAEGGMRGGAADTHLRSPSVWAPLRQCPPNQRAFICRFVLAAANTYGMLKKSLLWAALVPLLMAELRTAEGPTEAPTSSTGSPAWDLDGMHAACDSAGSAVRIAEKLLLPVLLHALCLRESEGQRATRQEWSGQLDRYVFQQPERCAHTARLLLYVLEQCHAVLLRSTRQRGLKGATVASTGRAKASSSSSSAAAAAGDGARTEAASWPSTVGSVPSLQDMGECYWLSDIPAARLARAAVRVGEPHLALLFSQLSGESFYGPRTGAAALCGASETTQSAAMLRDGAGAGGAVLAASSAPYSILFPFAKPGDYPSAASATHAVGAGATRSGGRARERRDAVRQQTRSFAEDIFDLYASVQGQLELDDVVGVSLMMRLQSATDDMQHRHGAKWCSLMGSGPALSASFLGLARSRSSGRVIRRVAGCRESGVTSTTSVSSGADDSLAAAPSAAAAWLDEMRLLEESETHHASGRRWGSDVPRAGSAADSGRSDGTVDVARHSVALAGEVQERRPDPWAAHLQRAALLLQHGFPSTALDVLLSLHPAERRREAAVWHRSHSSAAERGATDDSVRACSAPESVDGRGAPVLGPEAFFTSTAGEAIDAAAGDTDTLSSWTSAHEVSLQALLAEAAWKSGRWSSGGSVADDCPGSGPSECVPSAVLDLLSLRGHTATPESRGALLMPASGGRFYVHLLSAFVTLMDEQPLLSMQHVRRAESALRQQLSPTTFVTTVMAAEALNEVRDCAARFLAANAAARRDRAGKPSRGRGAAPQWKHGNRVVELPMWLRSLRGDSVARGSGGDAAELPTARVPSTVDYASRELLDSVRHALCQVYGDDEGWYQFVLGATEQALLNRDAAAAHRWLRDWKEQHAEGTGGEGEQASPSPAIGGTVAAEVRGRARQLDLALRTAQIAYGLGRWQEALALLQPAATAARGEASLAHGNVALLRTAPWHAPQEPRVIQQLMVWHEELRLLPPSQLVRDPFLSRAAASDSSGACSFLLARLCHTLADDIATRLTSHEHQQLCESVEESKRLKADLEAQLEAATQPSTGRAAAPLHRPPGVAELDATTGATTTAVLPALVNIAGVAPLREARGRSAVADTTAGAAVGAAPSVILSEDQLRVIRRRIRELAGDIKRLEDEWQSEKSNFGLYRRSAINAYSRFLQFNQAVQQGAARGVTERTHRGAAAPSEVKCLPVDHEEDVVHAVFGFVELWVNAAEMEQGSGEVLNKVLDKAVERIPTAVFVPLAGQLTAQLGGQHEGERLAFLVARLARDYPMHVVWPLLALYHGHTFAKSRDVNTLHNVDEAKITAARQLLAGLASAQSSATASSRDGRSASTAALLSTQIRHAQLLSSAYLELALDRSAATAQVGKRHAISEDFMLVKDARNLAIPPPSSMDLFVTPAVAGGVPLAVPHVMRYRNYFTTPGGVNVPKVLQCELSDGTVVRQLLKAGDDLRQDALIEQVFATANRLFHRRSATRPLQVRTFTIVPLAPTAGILQWVEHTIPLGEYLTGRYTGKEEVPGAHERYFPGEPTTRECRIQLQNAPQNSKCQVLLSLYEKFTPALHYFFLEEYLSAQVWVDRQQTFTRSVAASSIVGYTVGLGDRHINNILLHRGTAEVVHIDLGIAFDQNKLLPVPELVPFRLTRNMIDGLGVRGTEGSLRPCAEAAMHLLRAKRELIRTILSSIMHDPLARWAIGSPTHANHIIGAGDAPQESNTRQPAPVRTHGSSADAARTLARIDAKLRGYDGGDLLSVPTHVRKLMEEAQRVESLAMMFPGWSQWV